MISPVKQLNAHRPVMHIMPVCCRVIFSRSQDLRWFLQETLWHCECVWLEALIWWHSALASRSCFVIFSLWSLNMFILLMSHRKTVFKITFMQALIWVKAGFLHMFFFLQVNYCSVLVMQFHYDLGMFGEKCSVISTTSSTLGQTFVQILFWHIILHWSSQICLQPASDVLITHHSSISVLVCPILNTFLKC